MDSPSVCGYIDGLASSPVTCTSGYCGFNSVLGAAGCCSSTLSYGNAISLTGCDYTTSCFDSTDVDGLDFNTADLLCTDALSPSCGTYTFTDKGYTAVFCTDIQTTIAAALTAADIGTGPASRSAAAASATPTAPPESSAAAPTGSDQPMVSSTAGGGGGAGGAGNPFPKAQGSANQVGAVGTATVVKGEGSRGRLKGRMTHGGWR